MTIRQKNKEITEGMSGSMMERPTSWAGCSLGGIERGWRGVVFRVDEAIFSYDQTFVRKSKLKPN